MTSRSIQVTKAIWDLTSELDQECEEKHDENKKLRRIIRDLKQNTKIDNLSQEDELVLQNISKQMKEVLKRREKRKNEIIED